jgi:cytochrome c
MTRQTAACAAFVVAVLAALPALAADSGDTLFRRYCSVCHDTEAGKNKIGPSLAGIVGRPSGDEAGFTYSAAMQSAGLTWDDKTIDQYITDPRSLVPGNKMLFPGVKDPAERKAIIDYLNTLKS